MRRALPLAPLLPLALLACGPVPVAQAERQCYEQARLAQQPRGEMRIGAGSGSGRRSNGDLELTVSTDWLAGRDPSAVYASCVFNKSGEPPRRPLYDRPDWKG